MGDLSGKVVIVTGAGQGIGLGVATHIAERGASTVIAEYNEGASNRQVWNAVAILAASRLLDDSSAARDAVRDGAEPGKPGSRCRLRVTEIPARAGRTISRLP